MKMRSEADMDEQIQELKTITRLQGEPTPKGTARLAPLWAQRLSDLTQASPGQTRASGHPPNRPKRRDQRGCRAGGFKEI